MEKRKRPPLPLDASPQEKYDNLILTFFEEWQEYMAESVLFYNNVTSLANSGKAQKSCVIKIPEINSMIGRLGFSTFEEFCLILYALIENEIIGKIGDSDLSYDNKRYLVPRHLKITFKGLNYYRSLLESGKYSTRCFVAMAYQPDMEPIYNEGIVKAIKANHFLPIRVDKEHTENEQTINDFIIASIKQSRFCIADLTHQRNGAYFEAGYALGRGLKVIYTCRRDDHENVHFDLKNMQIILYNTPEELRAALDLKIQAFILD